MGMLIIIFLALLILADDYYRLDNEFVLEITEHFVCKEIENNCGEDIFIPTKTSLEWLEFRTHAPAGVGVDDCAPPSECTDFRQCGILYPDCGELMGCEGGNCCSYESAGGDCPDPYCIQ